MFDIKMIRENPEAFDAGMARRGLAPQAQSILALDEAVRAKTQELNELQTRRNTSSKAIGAAKGRGDDDEFNRLRAEVDEIKAKMPEVEAAQKASQDLSLIHI